VVASRSWRIADDRWVDDLLTRRPAPVVSNSWQAYYHIMHCEGDKSSDVHRPVKMTGTNEKGGLVAALLFFIVSPNSVQLFAKILDRA
jgi:hypothetical protein